jgi:HD-GYP domain-containing protein (c-di-GMP phosphodiesterase class II)
VLHHHERWDGTGYPDRLSAERIPLGARILFVADAYDAMTSDRVYRSRLTSEAALEELERCAGTQFDPEIVRALAEELALTPAIHAADALAS